MFEVSILTINPIKLNKLTEEKAYLGFFEQKKDKAATDIMIFNFLWDYASAMILSAMIASQFATNQIWIFAASALTAIGTLYIATLAAKLFASKKSDLVIKKLGWLIIGIYWALKPAVLLISTPILFLLRGMLNNHADSKLSDGELLGVLAMAKKDGLLAANQHSFIKRVIGLQSQTVADILPKDQVLESVDIEANILSLKDKITKGCHKRIVVTKTHNDKLYPQGILLYKDIVRIYVEHLECKSNGEMESCTIPSIPSVMRPCIATPETAVAHVLINKLDKGDHIVVATKEDGTISGVMQSDDIIHAMIG